MNYAQDLEDVCEANYDVFDNLWMRGFRGLEFNTQYSSILLQRGVPVEMIEDLLPSGRDFDAWNSMASMEGWYTEVYESRYDAAEIEHYRTPTALHPNGNPAMIEYIEADIRDSGKTNEQRFQENLERHDWKLVDMGCPGVYIWTGALLYNGFNKAEVWEQLPN